MVTVVRELVRSLRDRGHEVVLCFPWSEDGTVEHFSHDGVPSYRLRLRPPRDPDRPVVGSLAFLAYLFGTLRALNGILRDEDVDVVNIHYPEPSSVHYLLAARWAGVPVLSSAHGTDVFPDPGADETGAPSVAWCLRLSKTVVCPSRAYADRIRGVLRGSPTRVAMIHHGVDPTEFSYVPPAGRPSGGQTRLLTVSVVKRIKGLDVLVRALSLLRDRDAAVRLRIAGDGPQKERLEDLVGSLGIESSVAFLGRVGRDRVHGLLGDCDVFVSPSRAESLGIAVLEAMSVGRPVVASRVGGLQESVVDGKTGILVPPDEPPALADAIGRLAEDASLRDEMGRAARRRVENHFDAERMTREYLEEYRRLLPVETGVRESGVVAGAE